jgi:GxxExxY protein
MDVLNLDPEAQRLDAITEKIIGGAIEVHRGLGPGLLESAYEECLCYELAHANLRFERQVPLPVIYKGIYLDCGYRMDLLVEGVAGVEVKAVERLIPVHEAQLLSYLKLGNRRVGLLMNFHAAVLKNGLKRIVNNF